jgi:hypothetical protein
MATCTLIRPLLAQAGVAAVQAAQECGKAGLSRRLGWVLGASFVFVKGLPTNRHHPNIDQYFIRPALVYLSMHDASSMPAYTRRRCTSIRISLSQHATRDSDPPRMFFKPQRIARRIGSSILTIAC